MKERFLKRQKQYYKFGVWLKHLQMASGQGFRASCVYLVDSDTSFYKRAVFSMIWQLVAMPFQEKYFFSLYYSDSRLGDAYIASDTIQT